MMFAAIAAMLFPAAALFAVAAIGLSWLRYGPIVRSLRNELAGCETKREVRFVLVTTEVRRAESQVLRPEFRPLAFPRLAWRAAA